MITTVITTAMITITARGFWLAKPTLAQDLFAPVGGLWSDHQSTNNINSNNNNNNSNNSTIGVKICLECFTLLAEDCTDSDFNVKISTQRRNDVLTGLNEIAHTTFLPLFFQLLERHYQILQQSKQSPHQMHQFLLSEVVIRGGAG